MPNGRSSPDAFITEAQEDRLHAVLEYAVYYWSLEHKMSAEMVKSLVIQIAQIMNQSLFTGDGKSDAEIAQLAVSKLAA